MRNNAINKFVTDSFYEMIDNNPRCSRGNYPHNFNVFLERLRELLDTRFKRENFTMFEWIQNTPTIKNDYFDGETGTFKDFDLSSSIVELPLYHVHVRHHNELILSILYDEHQIASMIMSDFYFEIYPLPDGDIDRFYFEDMETMLKVCEVTIAINYREYMKRRKVIELKDYFDRKSIDRNALNKRRGIRSC